MGLVFGAIGHARRQCGREDVTVADVLACIVERMRHEPIVAVHILATRYFEIAAMVFDSKHIGANGDYKLYCDAHVLAQSLFAAANCHLYVHIGACSIEQRKVASDAQRLVYEKILFTKKSSTGAGLAHADEFVEWLVNDARALLGKHMTRGRADHIMRTIMQQPELIAVQRARAMNDEPLLSPRSANTTHDGQPRPIALEDTNSLAFVGGRKFAEVHGFWVDDAVRRRHGAGFVDVQRGAFLTLGEGEQLNAELLDVPMRGLTLLLEFYKDRRVQFGTDAFGVALAPVAAPHMEKRFRMPAALAAEVLDRRRFEDSRPSETRFTRLMASYTGTIEKGDNLILVPEATAELEEWRTCGADAEVDLELPAALPTLKSELIEILARVRIQIFNAGYAPRGVVGKPKTPLVEIERDAAGHITVNGRQPVDAQILSLPALAGLTVAQFSAPSHEETAPPLESAPAPPTEAFGISAVEMLSWS